MKPQQWALRITVAAAAGLMLQHPALADDQKIPEVKRPHAKKVVHHKKVKPFENPIAVGTPTGTSVPVPSYAPGVSLQDINRLLSYRGWDIHFPSMADSVSGDSEGYRSTLAKYGIGFLGFNVDILSANLLNTPKYNLVTGAHDYFGQRPDNFNGTQGWLTYDLSRFGISDGQLSISGEADLSTDPQRYIPNRLAIIGAQYYQTFFDKKLEFKIGQTTNASEWAGTVIGGNLANPFGSTASILGEVGLAQSVYTQPTLKLTYHPTAEIYNQFGAMRSINSFVDTTNFIVNETKYNPTGFDLTEPKSRLLLIDEIGYKNEPGADRPMNWFRVGGAYNNSPYQNFKTGGTSETYGLYALADRQFLQTAPKDEATAYRGLYGGVSAMYAPPQTASFSQYYEARVYSIGITPSRPFDQITFAYDHNVLSHYIVDEVNTASSVTNMFASSATNSYTVAYTAKLTRGIYVTTGVGYTDKPSPLGYYNFTGHSLNFLASSFIIF